MNTVLTRALIQLAEKRDRAGSGRVGGKQWQIQVYLFGVGKQTKDGHVCSVQSNEDTSQPEFIVPNGDLPLNLQNHRKKTQNSTTLVVCGYIL